MIADRVKQIGMSPTLRVAALAEELKRQGHDVATANCTIEGGETKHTWKPVQDVTWGTSTDMANGTAAPDDPGGSSSTVATGTSFTNAANPGAAATWVLFQPDGLPRLFTPSGTNCTDIGLQVKGGGAIYLTNTRRDYAIVLSHLGTVRVHGWNPVAGAWSN